MHATIFDIKHYAIHDGPGIRQTIFFKGCALNCWWCHNPESRSKDIVEVAGEVKLDNQIICTNETIGRRISLEELMKEISKDIVFFEDSGGGITLSGGEPLLQLDFMVELLNECKNKGIHTCIDTTGFVNEKSLMKVIDNTDLFLYDLKMVNNEKHIKYTGVSNEKILSNLKFLDQRQKKVWIRIPLIPEINDTLNDINDFIRLINGLSTKYPVSILPYHKIGSQKYNRLGIEDKMHEISEPTEEQLEKVKNEFLKNGIEATIGG